jgi:hypothetical protein
LRRIREIAELSREDLLGLLQDAGLNWLTHDGLWFRTVEEKYGLDAAMELDRAAWEKFTVTEAKRIMKRLGLEPGGGIPALVQALRFRLYAHVNTQEIVDVSASRCVFRMITCRVQEARHRQGLAPFPCRSVGIVEYSGFASTIDPRIETRCLFCPPGPHPGEAWCAWEFAVRSV